MTGQYQQASELYNGRFILNSAFGKARIFFCYTPVRIILGGWSVLARIYIYIVRERERERERKRERERETRRDETRQRGDRCYLCADRREKCDINQDQYLKRH